MSWPTTRDSRGVAKKALDLALLPYRSAASGLLLEEGLRSRGAEGAGWLFLGYGDLDPLKGKQRVGLDETEVRRWKAAFLRSSFAGDKTVCAAMFPATQYPRGLWLMRGSGKKRTLPEVKSLTLRGMMSGDKASHVFEEWVRARSGEDMLGSLRSGTCSAGLNRFLDNMVLRVHRHLLRTGLGPGVEEGLDTVMKTIAFPEETVREEAGRLSVALKEAATAWPLSSTQHLSCMSVAHLLWLVSHGPSYSGTMLTYTLSSVMLIGYLYVLEGGHIELEDSAFRRSEVTDTAMRILVNYFLDKNAPYAARLGALVGELLPLGDAFALLLEEKR